MTARVNVQAGTTASRSILGKYLVLLWLNCVLPNGCPFAVNFLDPRKGKSEGFLGTSAYTPRQKISVLNLNRAFEVLRCSRNRHWDTRRHGASSGNALHEIILHSFLWRIRRCVFGDSSDPVVACKSEVSGKYRRIARSGQHGLPYRRSLRRYEPNEATPSDVGPRQQEAPARRPNCRGNSLRGRGVCKWNCIDEIDLWLFVG